MPRSDITVRGDIRGLSWTMPAPIGPNYDRLLSSARYTVRGLGILIALALVASLSFVYVDKDQTGHKDKVYGLNTLKEGAILATGGKWIRRRESCHPAPTSSRPCASSTT